MPTVHVEAELSYNDLLKAVEQLSLPELEQFVHQVVTLRAQRNAPFLPGDEAGLLLNINQGLPTELQRRYNELIAKRQAETLTLDEYQELLDLTGQVEQIEAKRVEYLAELARLRQMSLTEVVAELGIQMPPYV